MALSQKHAGKYLVPWFCSAEWLLVFENIYGKHQNTKTRTEALKILNIWKSRTPLLPRGVEGTYIILEAILIDRSNYNEYNTQLLLSTSIMRFLNICAAYDKNQGSFYQTAYKIKLPEWLINLRHDIAHGQSLPTLYTLDSAMQFCLEWLYREYWKPAMLDLKDFVDDTEFQCDKYDNLKNAIQPLVTNYCYALLATHPFWNIHFVRDVADEETKTSFLDELKMLTNTLDINENIAFTTIQKLLWQNIEKLLDLSEDDVANKEYIIPELLVKENIFLGDFDERKDIFDNSHEIPESFLVSWEKLLIIMQRLNMIEPLIEKLLGLLAIDELKHETKVFVSLWLLEIGKGLSRCLDAEDMIEQLSAEKSHLNKMEIKNIVQEKLKEQYKGRYMINFNHNLPIPDITTNITKFKTLFLEKPNQYTKIFIFEYLNLNKVFEQREEKKRIINLIRIYTGPSKNDVTQEIPKVIRSVEELMDVDENEKNITNTNKKCPDEAHKSENDNDELKTYTNKKYSDKRWRKITEFNFVKCPIGILPWQEATMNPLLH